MVEGEVLVVPKAGLPEAALGRIATGAGGRIDHVVRGTRIRVLKVRGGYEQAIAARMARNPHIRSAEPNWLVAPNVVPNDPLYGNGWHLLKIGAPTAWSQSLAGGSIVAVLDTGVFGAHPDLVGRVLSGWNVESSTSDVTDVYGHGTKVAGVVAGSTNNALGISSVGWGARILPVKITNAVDGYASSSSIASGIAWAGAHGANVVNVSYDIVGLLSVESAAQQFRNLGGVVVVAAGNTGTDRGYGSQSGIMFVAGTTSTDAKASWSSFGSYVDIAAPGEGIASTNNSGGYGSYSGTSFSSPVVAGVVALMRTANAALPPAQIEALLQQTSVDLGTAGYDKVFGWGRVNAAAAVAAAAAASAVDTQAPTVAFSAPLAGALVSGLATVKVAASDNVGVVKVALSVNGLTIASETAAPWDFVVDTTTFPGGTANFDALAYDAAGNSRTTRVAVSIANGGSTGGGTDTTAPVVTISSPTAGSAVSGTVTIGASASDSTGVSMLTVSVDGQLLCSGAPVVSCAWNTRNASVGPHSIVAVATDPAGNRGSASVSVGVGTTATKGRKR